MRPLQSVQNLGAPADTGLYLLDRIDQRYQPLDHQYIYTPTGRGVHIYIIDSGIRGGHQEWGYGRIGASAAFIKWSIDPSPTIDQLGHGTAVAGAAAGSRIGVAKDATLHSVRIDDGGGGAFESDIIAGLDWVAANRSIPAVANLSYDNNSAAIAQAITGVISHNVSFVTAAGNDRGADACNPSTQVRGGITVGATTVDDHRATYSNIGTCVDVFAPGGESGGYQYGFGLLQLASNTDNSAYTFNEGTSFAAPVAAGVAALVLEQNSGLSPTSIENLIVQSATPSVVIDAGPLSPNRLLYSRITAPPPPPSPSVSIDGPAQIQPGATCTWRAIVTGGSSPYNYQWTNDWMQAGNSYEYTGSKLPDNTGSSFSVSVSVTDAVGGSGNAEITVFEDSSAPACFQ